MSTSEKKFAGNPPAEVAAVSKPAAFVTPEDGEDWQGLIAGLTEALDELYAQHVFNEARARQQAARDMVARRLSHFRDSVIDGIISSLRHRLDLQAKDESQVELTALETQLQEARASLHQHEKMLEETKRQADAYLAENRRLHEMNENLKLQFEKILAENQRLRAMAAAVQPAQTRDDLSDENQTQQQPRHEKTIPSVDESVFASVLRLARSCAGQELVFDSEEQVAGFFDRVGQTLDMLLDSVLKLIHGRWQFRTEFIGQTIIHSAKSFTLQTARSASDVKKFIFAAGIHEEEFGTRHQLLKQALDELMFHQLALLEGYRTCVKEGSQKLLQVLDPAILTQKLNERKINLGLMKMPLQAVPLFFQLKLLDYYRRKHADLIAEDRRIFEKKMFRPGFIRGYEARLASALFESTSLSEPPEN